MVDVFTSIVINRAPEKVSAYASEPDNAVKWYKNIKSVEWITSRPLSLNTRVAFRAKFLGRVLAYVYEIVELEPGKSW